MKIKRTILQITAIMLLASFIAGNMGVTMFMHTCNMANKTSVRTVSAVNPHLESTIFCSMSAKNSSDDKSVSTNCCDYATYTVQMAKYLSSASLMLSHFLTEVPFTFSESVIPVFHSPATSSFTPDRHGGRSILNFNCQLLS